MSKVLRFSFQEGETKETVEADVALAIFIAECLYGRPRVRMETAYLVEETGNSCVIDIGGEAGEATARVFAGLTAVRLGEDAYTVRHADSSREIADHNRAELSCTQLNT